jgi:hypothetical protein
LVWARGVLLAFTVLVLPACPRPLPLVKLAEHERILELQRIHEQNNKRENLVALLEFRPKGVRRLFMSFDADAIFQAPDSFYMALRSFFEQPMRLLSFDGSRAYALDLSQADAPRFGTSTDPEMLALQILSLPLKPSEVVDIFLGRLPFRSGNLAEVSKSADARDLYLELVRADRKRWVARLDADTYVVKELALWREDQRMLFVRYHLWVDQGGIALASDLVFEVVLDGRTFHFDVVLRQVELNGESRAPSDFRIGANS